LQKLPTTYTDHKLDASFVLTAAGKSSHARKNMLYEARYYGQTSSARLYTGSHKKSGFTKKPTAEEQLNEKQLTNELLDQRESGRIERKSVRGDRKAAVGEC
jgi:hypothetical protein